MKNQILYLLLIFFLVHGFCIDAQSLQLSNSTLVTGMEKQDLSDPVTIAREYIQAHLSDWGLTPGDMDDMTINDMYTDKKTGITRIYFLQRYEGIPVSSAILNISIDRTGKVFFAGNRFETEIESKINTTVPTLSPTDAVILLAANLGVLRDEPKSKLSIKESQYIFDKGSMASEDITAELAYQPYNGKLRLAWDILFSPLDKDDKWSTRVDAITGEVLDEYNLTVYCSPGDMIINENDNSCIEQTQSLNSFSNFGLNEPLYNVWPAPIQGPNYGQRALTSAPVDTLASPFGWHDTDGQPGPEYTITRGNNVHAFQDQKGDFQSKNDEPDGGPDMIFDFPFDPALEPAQYVDAAVVNLFYWTNYMHDFAYQFGFDEAAGNFQQNNYGKGGLGNDAIIALTQQGADKGNANNATFSYSKDGTISRMSMYIFRDTKNFIRVDEPAFIAGWYKTSFPSGGWGTGAYVTDVPVSGEVVLVNDGVEEPYTSDACEPIINAADLAGKIAIIDRGGCEFGWKALKAQEAGAIGVLVCNFDDDNYTMNVGNYGANVQIPILMIARSDYEVISQYIGNGLKITFVDPGQNNPVSLDSDLDNSLIAHEFGHGISDRLVGGPGMTCLGNEEEMSEGWSDFFFLVTTILPGDTGEKRRGFGTYATKDAINGKGFRRFPYSTDMSIMPLTYGDLAPNAEEHNIGEIWCAMLWDMYWAFTDRYGWSENPYEEWSGNYKAIKLVFEGLKNTPCKPGFVDGRNAILAADESLFNGENQCMIWEVFARRGLGYSANQGSPFDSGDQKEAFDIPPVCTNKILVEKSVTDFIQPGEDIQVTITVGNFKPEKITNVVVTDELPDSTLYKINSANLPVDLEGNTISFNVGDLNKNEEKIITYTLESDANLWSERKFLDTVAEENNHWLVYTMGPEASNDWTIANNQSTHSGIYSWLCREVPERSRQVLELNPDVFTFHVDGDHPALRFYHRYETKGGVNGGIIEVKETNSDKWHQVNDSMLRNGYTGGIDYRAFVSPNLEAFSGFSGEELKATYVDLSPWDGKDIQMRFRFATIDSTFNSLGWIIDDIEFMDLLSYNSEVCVTSDQGDYECAIAPESGTIVDSREDPLSSTDVIQKLAANIYPNPATDLIHIVLPVEDQLDGIISLRSIEGKEILTKTFGAEGKNSIAVSTASLPSGIYIVDVRTTGGRFVGKVIVQK